jgi:hypothetical protein
MTDEVPKKDPHESYEVGYGRPPVVSRFRDGVSGNRNGRPRGSKNFRTEFEQELAQSIVLNENGRRKRMPKRRAIAKQLINKALNNDPKATALVIEQMTRNEEPGNAPVAFNFDRPFDVQVIDEIVRRIRLADEPSPPAAEGLDSEGTP